MKPGSWIDDPIAEAAYTLDCGFTDAAERLSSADSQLLNAIGDLAQDALNGDDPRHRLNAQRVILSVLVAIAPEEVRRG